MKCVDPICGMQVAESTPHRAVRDGETFYFCSNGCRQHFEAAGGAGSGEDHEPQHSHSHAAAPQLATLELSFDPDPHIHRDGGTAEKQHSCCHGGASATAGSPKPTAAYFCPMCPGVEIDKPGDCPKCGMALEANPSAVNATVWTCPMHLEI